MDKINVNETIDNYLQNLNNLLEKHVPSKELIMQDRKFQEKPWFAKGLQVSIKKNAQYLFFIFSDKTMAFSEIYYQTIL